MIGIAGIVEKDTALLNRFKKKFDLPDSIFYTDIDKMVRMTKPDVVLGYNPINEHLSIVEACAPRHIPVMVEKPLATTLADATRMAELAKQFDISVFTNYETSWYDSNQYLYELVKYQNVIGPVVRIVVHSGHIGPKEKGVQAEFLHWLTDPIKNGGGAITDFGCYGANLMTWMMNNKATIAVTAIIRTLKPKLYPKVDDDATIILEYPEVTGIIEASWNWPFPIKDWKFMEKLANFMQ